MGPTRWTAVSVAFVLTLQVSLAIGLRGHHPLSPLVLAIAYVVGGTANQNTFLSIHEITHNLAFKGIKANKLLAIVSNFAIAVPYAMAFKGYHIEHHKFLGEDGIDTDLPSRIEAVILNNVAGKTFFA
jgi:sphingolipid delta-4 desaturase